jgi:hypothetical protein
VTVNDGSVFFANYTGMAAGVYTGSSGNLNLNDLDFLLSPLVTPSDSEYLVNILVTDKVGGATSETSLSAITVDTTPEPSTVLLLITGLGSLGFAGIRRRRRQ